MVKQTTRSSPMPLQRSASAAPTVFYNVSQFSAARDRHSAVAPKPATLGSLFFSAYQPHSAFWSKEASRRQVPLGPTPLVQYLPDWLGPATLRNKIRGSIFSFPASMPSSCMSTLCCRSTGLRQVQPDRWTDGKSHAAAYNPPRVISLCLSTFSEMQLCRLQPPAC